MHRVDKPQPIFAGLAWIAILVATVTFDGRAVVTALGDAAAYSLIGAAFGLSAFQLGRTLLSRVPTEGQVSGGRSLRRFRAQVIGTHFLTVAILLLAVGRVDAATDPVSAGDGAPISFLTFWLLQIGLGWPWYEVGRKAAPDRPDAARV
jgi:hypothetical protein